MQKTVQKWLKYSLTLLSTIVAAVGLYSIGQGILGRSPVSNMLVELTLLSIFYLLIPFLKKYFPSFKSVAMVWLFFLVILWELKNLQYLRYVSTGFDLGIRANILYNILAHGKVWDSLNQNHGFAGHFWPIAFLMAYLLKIWFDPRILLLAQTLWLTGAVFPLWLLLRKYRLKEFHQWLFLFLFLLNPYFHNLNSFDFHPETLGTFLMLWFVYFIETNSNKVIPLLLMLFALTLKEDVAIAFGSVALYGILWDKERQRFWLAVAVLSATYFAAALLIISRYGQLGQMVTSNYSISGLMLAKRLEYGLKFFASLGLLPLLSLKNFVMLIFPFVEHISSSWKPHFHLEGQYTAMLLPISIYIAIKNFSSIPRKTLEYMLIFGVVYSISRFKVTAYLPLKAQMTSERCLKIDSLLASIPDSVPVSGGNHITPHIALRDDVYQLPHVSDAHYVIVDTTWHDFYPLSGGEFQHLIDSLAQNGYYFEPDDSGVLILRRSNASSDTSIP